jgi:hypothetical protein
LNILFRQILIDFTVPAFLTILRAEALGLGASAKQSFLYVIARAARPGLCAGKPVAISSLPNYPEIASSHDIFLTFLNSLRSLPMAGKLAMTV